MFIYKHKGKLELIIAPKGRTLWTLDIRVSFSGSKYPLGCLRHVVWLSIGAGLYSPRSKALDSAMRTTSTQGDTRVRG